RGYPVVEVAVRDAVVRRALHRPFLRQPRVAEQRYSGRRYGIAPRAVDSDEASAVHPQVQPGDRAFELGEQRGRDVHAAGLRAMASTETPNGRSTRRISRRSALNTRASSAVAHRGGLAISASTA